mgnify:CR=1 FL=1
MESMNESRSIRVIIADDQELVRAGFAMVIGSQPDMEVVGQASDGAQAVALAESLHPDVVLMDDDPAKIALAMRIARRTLRIVHQNIVFALGIKALCLLLGALGIAGMWAAIFADVGVMVIAVLNATRALYTKDLTKN